MIDTLALLMSALCIITLALALWMAWLYSMSYKRVRSLETDNYRLMRHIGRIHSVSLGDTTLPDPFPIPQTDSSPVPAFFRMRRPTPPPGYKSTPRKDDL